jgi:hypothetical protein
MQKTFTLLIFLLLAGLTGVQAQNLILTTKDGVITRPITTLKRFTFSNNSLLVNYLSGPVETYSLDNVSKLTFKSVVTGVDNLSLTGAGVMKVYPNPVSNVVYIQNAPETDFTVSIYRMNGVLVLTTKLSSGTKSIDVSYLSSGLYLLNVNSRTFKFVKL